MGELSRDAIDRAEGVAAAATRKRLADAAASKSLWSIRPLLKQEPRRDVPDVGTWIYDGLDPDAA